MAPGPFCREEIMPTSGEFVQIFLEKITVKERKRKKVVDIESLAESIRDNGLFHPVVITRDLVLVAGERRFRAYQHLHTDAIENSPWPIPSQVLHPFSTIPCQYVDQLNEGELKAIELEENVKRSDLAWEEEVEAVLDYHEWKKQLDSEWTVEATAKALHISDGHTGKMLSVAAAMRRGDARVASCETYSSAYNILQRQHQRGVDSEMEQFVSASKQKEGDEEESSGAAPLTPASRDLLVEDFRVFAKEWEGPTFNLIHCDFPYGIGHDKSDQGGGDRWGTFEDNEDTYWSLIDCLLDNKDRLISHSAHILFWFSMTYYEQTRLAFARHDFVVNPFPLVWYKSDNTGILPDPSRGPRRLYETALLITRGDRKIIQAVGNLVAVASDKRSGGHLSEKPVEAVSHFFRMLVDSSTSLLDPTCGTGSAILAAEELGARRVLGMDLEEEHVEEARRKLNNLRTEE